MVEIDLEKCNFRNFTRSLTLTLSLDWVEVILCTYLVNVYPHTKLGQNRKKTFCERTDGRTDVQRHLSYNLLSHHLVMT